MYVSILNFAKKNLRRGTAFLALVALLLSGMVALDNPSAALATNVTAQAITPNNDTSTTVSVPGFSIPATSTGTIRVLLYSSNPNARMWFSDVTNIDGGIRGTDNYPDPGYLPANNYEYSELQNPGRMIGLVDTTAATINTSLASLKYLSSTASTDTVKMWVSNGTEYVPLINGSNVEFHYYGVGPGTVPHSSTWANVRGINFAGAARTINNVSVPAGTSYLATPRYRAENQYLLSLTGSNTYWIGGSDSESTSVITPDAVTSEGAWKWYGPDASGVQFWLGGTGGSVTNGEYNNWGMTGSTTRIEPSDSSSEDCLMIYNAPYSYNTGSTNGVGWNDGACSQNAWYTWELFQNNMPYGSNTSNPAASNYAPAVVSQTVSVAAAIAAPSGFSASSSNSSSVTLNWNAPTTANPITDYQVQYSTTGNAWSDARLAASTSTTQTITGLTAGTYYQFRVAAVTSDGLGTYANTYFTPKGAGQVTSTVSTTKNISTLSVDPALASYRARVLLRLSSNSGTIQLGTYANVSGIRGTDNYSSTAGAVALGSAGQMIGLTGTVTDINTALASLKFNASTIAGSNAISMWSSIGTTSALPQEYLPIVNERGQVDFHYYGYSGGAGNTGTWNTVYNKAPANTSTINGQTATGKYLASAESAEQNAMIGSAMTSASVTAKTWIAGVDWNNVNASTADGAWYWTSPESGLSQFYNGTKSSGNSGIVNSAYVNWGATSTVQNEPNVSGTNSYNYANCLAAAGNQHYTHGWVNGTITPIASTGGITWDDYVCGENTFGYVWEFMSAVPVGTATLGNNYVANKVLGLTINPNAEAPGNVVAVSSGSGTISLSWTTPTVHNTTALTGYKIEYSTSENFATSTVVNTGNTDTYAFITGLSANTPYFIRLTATGADWTGATSSNTSATTTTNGTTITVVTDGSGGIAGIDYTNTNGTFTAKNSDSAVINAADIQAALQTQGVTIAADNIVIDGNISWSTSQVLKLGSGSSSAIRINALLSASGVSGGLHIVPASYELSVKRGGRVQLTGSSASLKIGNDSYSVINTVAGLSSVTASSIWALGAPISLTSSTTSVLNLTFTGTFDGLGNKISDLNIAPAVSGNFGFFATLGGAKIRNVGFENASISTGASGANLRLGILAGNGSAAGTNVVSQVWAKGSISQSAASGASEVGGLIGGATAGTLNISKSWTSVSISTYAPIIGSGGIIGANASSFGTGTFGTGNTLTVSESYTLGNIARNSSSASWVGNGGIIGVAAGLSTNVSNVFSWSSISLSGAAGNTSKGGIIGVGAGTSYVTLSNSYTTSANCFYSTGVNATACSAGAAAGAAVSGLTSGVWSPNSTLANLPSPSKTLFVQVVAPTDGSYGSITYNFIDENGTVQDLSAMNLSVSGTPIYTIGSNAAIGSYSVGYLSGLTLGGTSASVYSLIASPTSTALSITKNAQSITFTSNSPSARVGGTTYTPTATATSGLPVSFSVDASSSSICSINNGVVSFQGLGTCLLNATQAGDATHVAAPTVSQSINVSLGAQVLTFTSTAPNGVLIGGTPYAPNATGGQSTSPVVFSISGVSSSICTISNGSITFQNPGDCVIIANQAGDSNYDAASAVTQTVRVNRASQVALNASVANGWTTSVAWSGLNNTRYTVSGGSGDGAKSVSTTTPLICAVTLNNDIISVIGSSQGTCRVVLSKAGDDNFEPTSTNFEVSVLDLPAAPASFTVGTLGSVLDGTAAIEVTWLPPLASANAATITGYEVQWKNAADSVWTQVDGGLLSVNDSSMTLQIPSWTSKNIRVAATSSLDAQDGTGRNWKTYTVGSSTSPGIVQVVGALTAISSNRAAVTSGETIILTGTAFDAAVTTKVEISTNVPVFANTGSPLSRVKEVTATVISPTKISFTLPKFTMPSRATSVTSQVRVLTAQNVATSSVPLEFIPKKLTQTLAVTGLPASKAKLAIGAGDLIGTFVSTGVAATATAAPASVCEAEVSDNRVLVTPVGRGLCTVTVVSPATPGYSASTAKVYAYTFLGDSQLITFANPGSRTWSSSAFQLAAFSDSSLPVTYTSTTPLFCTVSGIDVTMLKAGDCSITANQVGDSTTEPAVPVAQKFKINKATRTPGLEATADSITPQGVRSPSVFTMTNNLIGAPNLDVAIGANPLELQVTLNKREGAVLFTTLAADEAAGRCTADSGDVNGLVGTITISDTGTCKVTISLPADDRYNISGETVVIWIRAVDLVSETIEPERGNAVESPADTDNNPKDPDTQPAVALTMGDTTESKTFSASNVIAYNSTLGKYTFTASSLFVGSWTVTMTAPATRLWFKQGTKLVNSCVTTLTAKKDTKLKKRVTRTIGAGCTLSPAGKTALTAVGVQKITVKYVEIRQYAKTGLNYQGTSKAKKRVLPKIKRTVVLNVGQ